MLSLDALANLPLVGLPSTVENLLRARDSHSRSRSKSAHEFISDFVVAYLSCDYNSGPFDGEKLVRILRYEYDGNIVDRWASFKFRRPNMSG